MSKDGPLTRNQIKENPELSNQLVIVDPFSSKSKIKRTPPSTPKEKRESQTYHINTVNNISTSTEKQSMPEDTGTLSNNPDTSANTADNSIPNSPSSTEGNHRNLNMAPPINGHIVTLKDALRVVPEFDGHNIPLSQFIQGCDEAKEMIGENADTYLAKLIRAKTSGEARAYLAKEQITSVKDLKKALKEAYGSRKTVPQLTGELGREYQRPNENVLTFSNRLRDIRREIMEVQTLEKGNISPEFQRQLDEDVVTCFRRGLLPEIENRIPADTAAEEMVRCAMKEERLLQSRDALRGNATPAHSKPPRKIFQIGQETEKNQDTRISPVCQLCRKPGHLANSCNQTMKCQLCNKIGHTASSCLSLPKPVVCQYCQKTGHEASRCYKLNGPPNPPSVKCQLCGNNGHMANACKNLNKPLNKPTITEECFYCKKPGHRIADCRRRQFNNQQQSENFQGPQESSASKGDPNTQSRSVNAAEITDLLCELIPLN